MTVIDIEGKEIKQSEEKEVLLQILRIKGTTTIVVEAAHEDMKDGRALLALLKSVTNDVDYNITLNHLWVDIKERMRKTVEDLQVQDMLRKTHITKSQ